MPTDNDTKVALDAEFIGAGDEVVVLDASDFGVRTGRVAILVDASDDSDALLNFAGEADYVRRPFDQLAHPDSPAAKEALSDARNA